MTAEGAGAGTDGLDGLTHLDAAGAARMVDVSAKPDTVRVARATGAIRMQPATLAAVLGGTTPKGDVLAVARVAGIMGAKRAPELIPLCHPVALSGVAVILPASSYEYVVSFESQSVTDVRRFALS